MDELKPCPFCGSKNVYGTYAPGTKDPEIFCNSCKVIFAIEDFGSYMNSGEDFASRMGRVKDAWNRRAKKDE